MKPPVLIRIYLRGQLQGVKQFTQGQIVLGSNEDVQVRLEGADVAPLHAMVEERESGYYLSDLGSSSGTFHNGVKVLDDEITSGDEIRIGDYKLQFFIGAPKPVAPPAPPEEVKSSIKDSPPPPVKSVTPPVEVIPKPIPVAKPAKHEQSSAVNQSSVEGPAYKAQSDIHSKKTLAPPSAHKDASEFIRPSKGTVVEVIVTWRERVIAARHFNESGEVTLGADPTSDLIVPLLGAGTKIPLVRIGSLATIRISPDMTGELIQDKGAQGFKELGATQRLRQMGAMYELDLQQGEMVRLGIQGNLISIYVRYVPETPKPLIAPVMDMTASEATGIILAVVVAAIWSLYMAIYSPKSLEDEALLEEPIRKATVIFKMPRKQIVEVKDEPVKQEKRVVKIVEQKRETTKPAVESPGKSGKAGEVAPSKAPPKPNKIVSAKPGGAIKTSPKEGAAAKSVKPDPTKAGLLGVFGSRGAQANLDKTFSGSGELQGMAGEATGFAGNAENRAGDSLGTKLKDTGGGGKGTATVGIAGVGTKGRGTGGYGYGTGGIGAKGSVDIDIGGQEAEFSGSIDREAIRRIVLANKSAIRSCYDRALQRKPDLYGKVVIEWDIEERGRVTQGRVKSDSLADGGGVARCVLGVIKSLRFPEPPPDQIGRVSYPFLFSSQ